jgi:hypothetical protein
MGKNDQVDAFNQLRLRQVVGKEFRYRAIRWGQSMKEWDRLIQNELLIKPGALVMVLANSNWAGHANGDLATVLPETTELVPWIQLIRKDSVGNQKVCQVWPILRTNSLSSPPNGMKHKDFPVYAFDEKEEDPIEPPWGSPYFDEKTGRYVMGAIKYIPLRLGWATTVHKSQGLSLDRVQIDVRDGFMGSPAMVYVGLSRARSIEGLKVVGTPALLARRTNIDQRIRPWL